MDGSGRGMWQQTTSFHDLLEELRGGNRFKNFLNLEGPTKFTKYDRLVVKISENNIYRI